MKNISVLNRKDKKRFLELLKKQFDFKEKMDYSFLTNNKNKIFIINKDIANIELNNIRINSMGLYIAEMSNNEVRLSIEGSQIIGPKSGKNIIELTKEQAREWIKGKDIEISSEKNKFVILKHDDDYLGTGKATKEKILNFIPKARRLNVSD
jgi:NOL1/NOP2/fmu family ribosome biogenesis protein